MEFQDSLWSKNIELYTNITNLTDELYAHNVIQTRWEQPTPQPPEARLP